MQFSPNLILQINVLQSFDHKQLFIILRIKKPKHSQKKTLLDESSIQLIISNNTIVFVRSLHLRMKSTSSLSSKIKTIEDFIPNQVIFVKWKLFL